MVIVGAKGLAKELLDILSRLDALAGLYFFDNVSEDPPDKLFGKFPVIRSFEHVKEIFLTTGDPSFALGLGNPALRYQLFTEFSGLGGKLCSVISPAAEIGTFDTTIGEGCCILPGAVITTSAILGKGCLVNPNATISHDSILGDFVEVSPGVNVTGNCKVGDFAFIGSNAVVLPKVAIGKNAVVAAGAVVTKNVPDDCMVAGVPAVVKKRRN